ncbi:MAG: hypothetical protein PHC51_10925 [bacterium]|nr:hypothetical protein [bacterium]
MSTSTKNMVPINHLHDIVVSLGGHELDFSKELVSSLHLELSESQNRSGAKIIQQALKKAGMNKEEAKFISRTIQLLGTRWIKEVNKDNQWFALAWGTARDEVVTQLQRNLAKNIASELARIHINLLTGGGPGSMWMFDNAWQQAISEQQLEDVVRTAIIPLLWTGNVKEKISTNPALELVAPPQITLDNRTALFFAVKHIAIVIASASGGLGTREEIARVLVAQQLKANLITGFSGIESRKLPHVVLLDEFYPEIGEWAFSGLQKDWAITSYRGAAPQELLNRVDIVRIAPKEEAPNHKLIGYGPRVHYFDDEKEVALFCSDVARDAMNGNAPRL